MIDRFVILKIVSLSPLLAALSCPTNAQTYQVGDDASAKVQSKSSQTSSPDQSLGWGTNIQNARLAQSATAALKRGDHALAVDYAQRAAQAAPGDAQLWFLLGYAARLDGKTQLSIDAYNRGLQLNPSALDGLSGLAQTYSTIGRNDEAQHLLMQVVSADPRRRDDALLLGDLSMRSGDYTAAPPLSAFARKVQQKGAPDLVR